MADPNRSPFDDVRNLLCTLPGPDEAAAATARARGIQGRDLGRVGALVPWMASWQGRAAPGADRALVAIFAASHGVALRAGAPEGPAATRDWLDAVAAGHAPINAICAAGGLGFKAFDLAVDLPCGDIAIEAAMDERGCVATMAFGMEAVAGGTDLLAVGEVGVGAELAAAALVAVLYGDAPTTWLDEARCGPEAAGLVTAAMLRHGAAGGDPLAILADLGGRDLAAMAGAILAARLERVPVILDGFAAAAAAAILQACERGAIGHCLAGHVSTHRHHGALLARLGLDPLLDLGIGAGAGIGAALAANLVKTALAIHRDALRSAREAGPSAG